MSFFLAFFFLLSHNNPTVAAPLAAPGPSLDHLFVGALTLVHNALTHPLLSLAPAPAALPAPPTGPSEAAHTC